MIERSLGRRIAVALLLLTLISIFVQDVERPQTPLMRASASGDVELVRRLIQTGVDVNERRGLDNTVGMPRIHGTSKPLHNDTALMYAVNSGQLEVVELLISAGAQVDAKDSWNRTVWDYMQSITGHRNSLSILKKIIGAYPRPFPEYGPKNVFYSAENIGDLRMVETLLPLLKEQGVMDKQFLTAAMCSAARGGTTDKVASRPVAIIDILRQQLGTIPDDTLGCVAPAQSVEKYEYLLSHGANPNVMSESGVLNGVLPLRMAVLNTHAGKAERIRAIETLLKYGADPTLKDKMNGVSALESARAQGDSAIVEMFERAKTNK